MKRFRWVLAGLLILAMGSAALAQPPGGGFRDRMGKADERFLEMDPKIGDPLPDVFGYDEERNKLALSSLKGSYSVIVFGCLT